MTIPAEKRGDIRKCETEGTLYPRSMSSFPQAPDCKRAFAEGTTYPGSMSSLEGTRRKTGVPSQGNNLPRGYEFPRGKELHIYNIYIWGVPSPPQTCTFYNPARGRLPQSRRAA